MCLAGTVVACWSLTQEVARWQVRVLLICHTFFVTEFAEFSEKYLGKTPLNLTDSLEFNLSFVIGFRKSKDFFRQIGVWSFFILPNPQEETGNFLLRLKLILEHLVLPLLVHGSHYPDHSATMPSVLNQNRKFCKNTHNVAIFIAQFPTQFLILDFLINAKFLHMLLSF